MTMRLQMLAEKRGVRVAALAEQSVDVYVSGPGRALAAQASLVPRAILTLGPEGLRAFAPDGSALSEAQVEALAPGMLARFTAEPARGQADGGPSIARLPAHGPER